MAGNPAFMSLPGIGLIGMKISSVLERTPLSHGSRRTIWLRFQPGVTALYGPNGVGKSRLLDQVGATLLGRGRGVLFAAVPSPSSDRDAFGWSVGVDAAFTAAEMLSNHAVEEWLGGRRETRSEQSSYGIAQVALSRDVIRSIADQMCYAARPSMLSPGLWLIAPAFFPERAGPALAAEYQACADYLAANYPDDSEPELHSGLLHSDWWSWPEDWVESDPDHYYGLRPSWAPVQLEFAGLAPFGLAKRCRVLAMSFGETPLLGPGPVGMDATQADADAHAARATALLRRFLDPAPRLHLEIGTPADWFRGTPPTWLAVDASSGSVVSLESLSDTQHRWAALAIRLANLTADGPVLVLCDEPERGLPVAAQKRLGRGMASVAEDYGVTFLLATHSGSILEDPRTHLVRVGRDLEGVLVAEEIDELDRDQLVRVGVPPWELPHLYRVVLLVEGLHDEWVIDELIGAELADLRVKVLPVHGVSKAARLFAADGDFLFTHVPDARFVVAVDGTRSTAVEELLEAARAEGSDEERMERLRATRARLASRRDDRLSNEADVLHTMLARAVASGRLDRVAGLFGFDAADIIEYLDCSHFVPGASWGALRAAHEAALADAVGTPKDFKGWLQVEHSAPFDEATIRRAVPQDNVPAEFTHLLEICRAASSSAGNA